MNLNDINFSPKHTEDELLAAIKWLGDDSVQRGFYSAANFAIFGTNKGVVVNEKHVGMVCHRYITDTRFQYRSLVATECGWKRREPEHQKVELFEPYFKWLTQDSFAAPFIVSADINTGFVVSADMYTPLMQNIMIMTRHFYEVPVSAFKAFNQMVSAGVPGNVAYPLAFNTNLSIGSPSNAKFTSYYSHRATVLFGLQAFKNFVKGELGAAKGDVFNNTSWHYRNHTDYRGGISIFFDDALPSPLYDLNYDNGLIGDLHKLQEFRDALAESRKGKEGSFYKAPNPFAPKPAGFIAPQAGEITNEEATSVLAPFLSDFLYRTES